MDPELKRRDIGAMGPMKIRVEKPTANHYARSQRVRSERHQILPRPQRGRSQYEYGCDGNDEHLVARQDTETGKQSAQLRIRIEKQERSQSQRKRQPLGVGNRRGLEED